MFSNTEELYTYICEVGIDVVDFKLVDLWGRWRHVSSPARKITKKILDDGFPFSAVELGFPVTDGTDLIFKPDPTTAFEEEWGDIRVLSLVCNVFNVDSDRRRFHHDPRYICEKAVKLVRKFELADEILFMPKFEFYVFDRARFENRPHYTFYWLESEAAGWNPDKNNLGFFVRHKEGYQVTPPQDTLFDFRNRLVAMLEEGKVPVKYHHHEVGSAGQIEIEVDFNNMLKTADSFLMLKYIAKNLASKLGKTATFMPKPIFGEAGSSLHLQMKMLKDGVNVFYDSEGYEGLSRLALYFIGGILSHMKSLSAFSNPSTNSYKRLLEDKKAPKFITYSTDQTTSSIKIPPHAKWAEDKCFEIRATDASCNPYIALAAFIMAGLDGIKNKMDPEKLGFSPDSEKLTTLPTSLQRSLEALSEDHNYLLKGNVFNENFVKNWINGKMDREVNSIKSRPHPYEFVLYYDI